MISFARFCIILYLLTGGVILTGPAASAEDFLAEVMTVKGSATVTNEEVSQKPLTEGDLLKPGDLVEVSAESYVDLAYDKHWKNLTRFGPNSRVLIQALFPTDLSMEEGDIFAKLDALSERATFEIRTPVAVVGVRGTAFRTIHSEEVTSVFNLSESMVSVFNLDANGQMVNPVDLGEFEKTEVLLFEPPQTPQAMSPEEIQVNENIQTDVTTVIESLEAQGRIGKLEDIETIHNKYGDAVDRRLESEYDRYLAGKGQRTTDVAQPPTKAGFEPREPVAKTSREELKGTTTTRPNGRPPGTPTGQEPPPGGGGY